MGASKVVGSTTHSYSIEKNSEQSARGEQGSLEFLILGIGHPGKVKTWSNVPYFFGKHLKRLGHNVHHADIGPNWLIQAPFDVLARAFNKLGPQGEIQYFRSSWNKGAAERKIKKALAEHPNAIPIFMTYTFGAAGLGRPYVVFSDRTFEQHIHYFLDRAPNKVEAKYVANERDNLNAASMIISLFPKMADSLTKEFGQKVKYFGNVVNLPNTGPLSTSELENKWRNKRLLFIGKRHYKKGLVRLIDALAILNSAASTPFELDVIGLNKRDLPGMDLEHVRFHGYLNKAVRADLTLYIELLQRAFLYVNPNPRWAAFSSSCEAMYLNTPLVIHPYPEFEQTFGDEEKAWWFLHDDGHGCLADLILRISSDREEWMERAQAARPSVAQFSWSAYASKVVNEIKALRSDH